MQYAAMNLTDDDVRVILSNRGWITREIEEAIDTAMHKVAFRSGQVAILHYGHDDTYLVILES